MGRIQLVLTDDWEVRGDGSGDMRRIQFDPMRTLVSIYGEFGLRASFNVEVMQQLYHLSYQNEFPELGELAKEWSDLVQEVYSRGHDVQLHVHPQWHNAQYRDGRWLLRSDWSLANHTREVAKQMLGNCKSYLESLLKPINPAYRCVSFKSGAWCIAPGEHVLPALIDLGIKFDMSIAQGLTKDGMVSVDYRCVDEGFLPYYPELHDARRMASSVQPIACYPTHSFYHTPTAKVRDAAVDATARLARLSSVWSHPRQHAATCSLRPSGTRADASAMERPRRRASTLLGSLKSSLRYCTSRTHYVSDLSLLSFPLMRRMIDDIRRRSEASGWTAVPVILANHTKDLANFEPIRKLAAYIAAADDLEVITLAELAVRHEAGLYPVRVKAHA
ncbi:MAG: hypothetical protein HY690_04390 [Chloroflexi bacterium]|nr:hypothetical protein [Chloroflexota bacterium]